MVYAILERARLQTQKKQPKNKKYSQLAAARFKPFMETLQQSRLHRLNEITKLNKEEYGRKLASDLGLKP